jgi:uncharacterized membrane protein HdeD (DUF308 family)
MTTVEAPAPNDWEMETRSTKWWILLLTGIAWVLIGVIVLDFDLDSAATIGYLVGAFLIAAGVTEFVLIAVTEGWKWLHAILGVLFVVAGIVAFLEPFQTFGILARMFGLLLVLKGTFDLIIAIGTRHFNDLWWMMLIAAIFEIALGFWASGYPGRSADLLILWVGIGGLTRGIFQIVMAFRARKVQKAWAV